MKILLLDDEYYFRQALKNMLEESSLEYQICGEAKDGVEGLRLMEETKPDIVLADINLPQLNGLEFIERAKKLYPKMGIIIISGYDRFEYAKKAIALGVDDYLLKPISREELNSALQKTVTRIRKVRLQEAKIEHMIEYSDYTEKHRRELVLRNLLLGEISGTSEKLFGELEKCNIVFLYKMFAVIAIASSETNVGEQECRSLKERIQRDIGKWHKDGVFCAVAESEERVGIILNFEERIEYKEYINEILRKVYGTEEHGKIVYGVGTVYRGLNNVFLSYQEAQHMCYQQLFCGNSEIYYEMVPRQMQKNDIFTLEKKMLLTAYNNAGNLQGVEQILLGLFTDAKEAHLSKNTLALMALEIMNPCMQYAITNKQAEILKKYFEFPIKKIQKLKSPDDILDFVWNAYQESIKSSKKTKKNSDAVVRAMAFIHEHFKENELNLEKIADAACSNTSYLCCIFKKEMGVTINRYIMQLKLLEAKRLMDNGGKYIKQIALESGFANESYFGKCFRNEFHMSPSEYLGTMEND